MFGILKRKAQPLGPFEFEHSTTVKRPAAEVYALVDWADPRNAKRALGNKVERVGTSPDRFRLHLDLVPDHRFEMIVTEANPGRRYAFGTEITPSVGRLVSSHETYTVEPIDEGSCRLGLTIAAWFDGRMSAEDTAMEVMTMGMSGQNALTKLKVQAEEGPDAVHAMEAAQMDCLDDFED
jgi:Polyketide cyclase / dehydrase and lipid transport